MYRNSCEEFIRELHSAAPVPGGGGASALMGSLGAALGGMVLSLSREKAKTEERQEKLDSLLRDALELEQRFLDLMDEDAAGFEPLSRAYKLPKNTEEEKKEREKVMEQALEKACEAPFAMLHAARETAEFLSLCLEAGAKMAISDVGVGCAAVRAAADGAVLNIYINAKLMKDEEKKQDYIQRAGHLTEEIRKNADKVYREVLERL